MRWDEIRGFIPAYINDPLFKVQSNLNLSEWNTGEVDSVCTSW
jgi:hypothetical protein